MSVQTCVFLCDLLRVCGHYDNMATDICYSTFAFVSFFPLKILERNILGKKRLLLAYSVEICSSRLDSLLIWWRLEAGEAEHMRRSAERLEARSFYIANSLLRATLKGKSPMTFKICDQAYA